MQHVNFSSLTRDQTCAPALEAWSLNPLTAREAPIFLVFCDPSLEGEMDDKMQRCCYWQHGEKTLGRLRVEKRQRFTPGGMGECMQRDVLPIPS